MFQEGPVLSCSPLFKKCKIEMERRQKSVLKKNLCGDLLNATVPSPSWAEAEVVKVRLRAISGLGN